MKLSALTPDTRNANKGTDRGRKVVRESLRKYGAGRSILIDKSGNVIAGNKTLEGAKAVGLEDCQIVKSDGTRLIAVQRTDLDINDKAARELAIADNRASELGLEWDTDVLKALETEADVDLSPFWDDKELVQFFAHSGDSEAPEPQMDRGEELAQKWNVRAGQLWEIPSQSVRLESHRLLCGDSTSPECVTKLMRGEQAKLFATDPPYAVGYSGGAHPTTKSNAGATTKDKDWSWSGSYNEADDQASAEEFYRKFVFAARDHAVAPNAAWYCWHASRRQAMVEKIWDEAGVFVHQQIIWFKSRAVLTYSTYLWAHEPCLYGWQRGQKPAVKTQHKEGEYPSTVWEIPNSEIESANHPTSKPLKLFSLPIEMHTRPGDLCYEPFSGSGSQLCAAENLGRLCYAIEISPPFVAVALQRLSDMGLQPVLADA